jgi:hypothetical protein
MGPPAASRDSGQQIGQAALRTAHLAELVEKEDVQNTAYGQGWSDVPRSYESTIREAVMPISNA